MAKQLREFVLTIGKNKAKYLVHKMAEETRRLLSVQAPVRLTTGGRLVATTPATPGAPPRKVSGKLYKSVKEQETKHGAQLIVYAPYAWYLEKSTQHPHPFFRVMLKNLGITGRNS